MPKRIQRKRTKGWKMPEGAVVVDGATVFGNPFKITHAVFNAPYEEKWLVENFREALFWTFGTKDEALAASLELFRVNAIHPGNESWLNKVRFALCGKDLVCGCRLDQPCHADVLLEIANRSAQQEASVGRAPQQAPPNETDL